MGVAGRVVRDVHSLAAGSRHAVYILPPGEVVGFVPELGARSLQFGATLRRLQEGGESS